MDRRLAWCCLPAAIAFASFAAPQPLLLFNGSASEPVGLYVRSLAQPGPGRLVAFHPPPAARTYVAAHMPQIGRGGILKELVAGPGAQLCIEGQMLVLDGEALGAVIERDSAGRELPHWQGCRVLGAGEYAAFSSRIPKSFDSRYFGPVRDSDLIGVFRPLWVVG
jgi:conjugative transfer signal peptidase TraF